MSTASQAKGRRSLFDAAIVRRAAVDALVKLAPATMMKNPVMFVVEVGSVLTTVLLIFDRFTHHGHFTFDLQITLWLWFTVLLTSVIVLVGALTFFPALSLGPILEHLLLHAGKTF